MQMTLGQRPKKEGKFGLILFNESALSGSHLYTLKFAKHFKEEDFVNRFVGLHNIPGEDKTLLVAPRLKQDEIGVCVWPSKYEDEEGSMLSARDRRRIVSISNKC